MRKITERMAREIYTRGFVLTKKYEYYKNLENGDIYRVPVEMFGKTELLDEDNHKFVCSYAEMCDLAFRGSEKRMIKEERYRVVGESSNCGNINRVYYGREIFFNAPKLQALNGYCQCVSNRYRDNPRFDTAEKLTIALI